MHSKRIRTLCLAGLLVAHAAGCSGLHTRLSDRLRGSTSATDSRGAPGVARLDSIGSPDAAPQADQPPRGAPILPAPPASTVKPGAGEATPPGNDHVQPIEPPVDPVIAARALLDDLGARITEDESGEVVSIDLAETGVTDNDLAKVAVFSRVRELNLRGTVISDAGLEALGAMTELEFLGLTGTQVTDAGLARLGNLERLRFLTLGRTSVSDAGLSTIINWSQLEGLNVKATRVTDRGAARLRRQLPKCRVIVDGASPGGRSPGSERADPNRTSERRESAPAPVLPRPNPEQQDNVERGSPDAIGPTPNSDEPTGRATDRRPFNIEEDWESAVGSPTTSATGMDPQQRLMLVLREKLEDPDVLKAIAEVQLSQQQPTEALRLLEAAADRAPEDRELRYVLGITRARCGDIDAAFKDLALAVGEAAAHYNLGVLLHEAGDDPQAIREFQRALRCDPNFRAAREWLAALTLPESRASDLADSQLLSDEQIRGLILQWTDRGTPRVEASLHRVDGAPPRLEAVAPVVEPAAPPVKTAISVEPELYPGRSPQAATEAPSH
jgi:hypothetical protein